MSDFYGARRFINVFKRVRHLLLSWARYIQSTSSHLITLRSILMLPSNLRLDLAISLYPSGFPTEILYTFLISPVRAPWHFIHLDFVQIWNLVSDIKERTYIKGIWEQGAEENTMYLYIRGKKSHEAGEDSIKRNLITYRNHHAYGHEKFIQSFSLKPWKEETIRKT
jgi:hypothetical protein